MQKHYFNEATLLEESEFTFEVHLNKQCQQIKKKTKQLVSISTIKISLERE